MHYTYGRILVPLEPAIRHMSTRVFRLHIWKKFFLAYPFYLWHMIIWICCTNFRVIWSCLRTAQQHQSSQKWIP